jgi:hypothetical protein
MYVMNAVDTGRPGRFDIARQIVHKNAAMGRHSGHVDSDPEDFRIGFPHAGLI